MHVELVLTSSTSLTCNEQGEPTTVVVTDEVQDFTTITHQLRGIYGIYLKLIKENAKITTCNWLDLDTLGS